MTERLPFHFSLSCIGEGNGNPLQCSCPENPRDGGAWWASVYGVAQSRTRLKRLGSISDHFYNEQLCECGYGNFPILLSLNSSTYFHLLHINVNCGKFNFVLGRPKCVT